MKESLTGVIVGAVVIMVLFGFVALPLLDNMTDYAGDITEDNEGAASAVKYSKGSSFTGSVTLGDGRFNFDGYTQTTPILILTDTLVANIPTAGNLVEICYKTADAETSIVLGTSDTTPSLTFSGNTWTVTKGSTTLTNTFSWCYYPDTQGVYYNATLPAYVDSNAPIAAWGQFTGLSGERYIAYGTIKDGMSLLYQKSTDDVATAVSAVSTETSYSNSLTSLKYVIGGNDYNLTSNIIVPIEYKVAPDPGIVVDLLGLIPILLIVGIITGLVGLLFYRRVSY